LLTSSNYDDN